MIGYRKYQTAVKIVEQYISEQKALIAKHESLKINGITDSTKLVDIDFKNRVRALNALEAMGYDASNMTIIDLKTINLEEILKYRNIGKKTYYQLLNLTK
jgi:hypothetical protein